VANTGVVGGNLTLNVVSATDAFWTEAFPLITPAAADMLRCGPSGLLASGSRVVTFIGRAAELSTLTAWRDQAANLAVMLIHARGGQGKTRLAAAFAEQSAKDGWAVAQARHHSDPQPPAPALDNPAGRNGLLVVVDYAERWPRVDIERLFQSRFLRQGGPARVLLVGPPLQDAGDVKRRGNRRNSRLALWCGHARTSSQAKRGSSGGMPPGPRFQPRASPSMLKSR